MRECSPPQTCHVSCVTCHVSRVTCQLSRVTFFFCFFFGQSSAAYWGRVCYQRGLPRLVFTNSAIWAGLVIESPCSYVCVSIIKVVIVVNGQIIKFFFIFIYISKDSKSGRTSKLHDWFKSCFLLSKTN